MKGKKKSDWKGTWTRDRSTIPVLLCVCILLLAVGYFLPQLMTYLFPSGSSPIEFTEIMAANGSAYPAPDGNYYSLIELHNRSGATVDLSDWKLGETYDIRGAFPIGDLTVAPDEYAVIYLTDRSLPDSACVPVKISKNGDELYLFNSSNALDQMISVPAMSKNRSSALNAETDAFEETELYTPGEPNTEKGHERVLSRLSADSPVRINELIASSRTSLLTADGEAPDWIELYNASPESVDLHNWSLTLRLDRRRMFVFPSDAMIEPDGYLVVYATDLEGEDGLRTGFSLPSLGGTVYLLDDLGREVSHLTWKKADHDVSFQVLPSGKITTDYVPTPGSVNAVDLAVDAQEEQRDENAKKLSTNPQDLYINEIVCSVSNGPDWIELYNASDAYIDLSGWWLSDKKSQPKMWAFPRGAGIAAGDYLVVLCCGDAEPPADQPYYSSTLSLSLTDTLEDHENILLSMPDGLLVDRVRMKDQRANVSYGRADGYSRYRYFDQLTPGAPNAAVSYAACASDIEFSDNGGKHAESSIVFEMRSSNGAKIYYTTDGSEPTSSSTVYTGPITLKNNTVIRAFAGSEDLVPTPIVTRTFILGYESSLRTVCITGSANALIGSDGVMKTGKKTTIPVNVEIYDYDGQLMIDQTCAFQTSGRSSRTKMPQKAFKLKAQRAYGPGKFKAKLFTDRPYTEFDSILMRASGQDMAKSHMRDSILTSLAADTSVMYQETELAAVFIDGKYWGMYNMRENLNEDSICQFEGWIGDNDKIDILSGRGMPKVQGNRAYYTAAIKFVQEHDMRNDANLEEIGQYIDIDNYIDFVCLMIYIDHEDLGNVMAYRNENADGKWRWAIFDQDLSYLNDKDSMRMWLSSEGSIGSITQNDNILFYQLMKNDSFRDRFLTRMGQLMATTFSSANVQAKIMARHEAIKDEMVYSCQRWDVKFAAYEKGVKRLYDYAGTRTAKLLGYIQKDLRLSDADMRKYFGDAIDNERGVDKDRPVEEDPDEE